MRVDVDESDLPDESYPEPPTVADNYRYDFWPEPAPCDIWFDVHVPKRMQADLLGEKSGDGAGAESFRIHTDYGWHGPCTFVSCLDGDEKTSPDKAVRVVHKFISQELKRSSSPIRMARVGPSPFHMVGTIAEDPSGPEGLHFEVVEVVGYRVYNFNYHPGSFDNLEAAEIGLHESVSREVQLFYDLIRRRNRRMHEAKRLSMIADQLAARHTRTGLKSWHHRVFRSGHAARSLALEAMQARLVSAQDAEDARSNIQAALENTRDLHAFTQYLEEESHDSTATEIETAVEIARLVESARSADYEVAIIAGSTLLGGLIGGIAGAGITSG
ncbi:hypothetical protein ACIGB8_01205 [Promicromonospora sukumoe]|uniref:hypothetical protein n=1 Tax=Promicromonospora sukumoe TaxID=88382 RepID=UPI0037C9FF7B